MCLLLLSVNTWKSLPEKIESLNEHPPTYQAGYSSSGCGNGWNYFTSDFLCF